MKCSPKKKYSFTVQNNSNNVCWQAQQEKAVVRTESHEVDNLTDLELTFVINEVRLSVSLFN